MKSNKSKTVTVFKTATKVDVRKNKYAEKLQHEVCILKRKYLYIKT